MIYTRAARLSAGMDDGAARAPASSGQQGEGGGAGGRDERFQYVSSRRSAAFADRYCPAAIFGARSEDGARVHDRRRVSPGTLGVLEHAYSRRAIADDRRRVSPGELPRAFATADYSTSFFTERHAGRWKNTYTRWDAELDARGAARGQGRYPPRDTIYAQKQKQGSWPRDATLSHACVDEARAALSQTHASPISSLRARAEAAAASALRSNPAGSDTDTDDSSGEEGELVPEALDAPEARASRAGGPDVEGAGADAGPGADARAGGARALGTRSKGVGFSAGMAPPHRETDDKGRRMAPGVRARRARSHSPGAVRAWPASKGYYAPHKPAVGGRGPRVSVGFGRAVRAEAQAVLAPAGRGRQARPRSNDAWLASQPGFNPRSPARLHSRRVAARERLRESAAGHSRIVGMLTDLATGNLATPSGAGAAYSRRARACVL